MRVSCGTGGAFVLGSGLDDSCVWLTSRRVGDRFKNMSDAEFDQVIAVHLKGAYACTKAAWPHFRNQKFGRVVNTSSAAGIYGAWNVVHTSRGCLFTCAMTGNFGQANYSAAKMGLIGFTKALAREGAKYNINAIAVAPVGFFPILRHLWRAC